MNSPIRSLLTLLIVSLPSLTTQAQDWQSVAPLPDGFVSNHSFGFALDGMGYIVAGESTDGYSDAFFQYDPAADSWLGLPGFPGPARGYTIGDTWDGRAWMGFGLSNQGYLNDLWVFDPESMTWTEMAPCPCEPRSHPAFVAEAGRIFVGLGGSPDGDRNDWWEYDMATDSWSEKPDFPDAPRHHPYQFGIDGKVYVGFGHSGPNIYNEWYRYSPDSEEWAQMATLPAEGRVAGTQLAHEGKGYALSGDGEDHSSMATGENWQYDPATDSWMEWPAHPGMSRWAPASFILDGEIYLINGMSMDPGSFDYMTTNWKFATVPAVAQDAGLSAFIGEEVVCPGQETPIAVRLTNWGSQVLEVGDAQALTVQMSIDGTVVLSSDWSGSLETYGSEVFTLGTYAFSEAADFALTALLEDENADNNSLDASVGVAAPASTLWEISLLTDNWGDETGWELRNAEGNLIAFAEPGSYADETLYNITIPLPTTGCYTFTLTDVFGDGMFGAMWGGSNGSCTIEALYDGGESDVIFSYDGSFGFETLAETVDVNTVVSVTAPEGTKAMSAYPNPIADRLIVEGLARGDRWELTDVLGRPVQAGTAQATRLSLSASDWPSGPMLLRIFSASGTQSFRLIKP
jgi:N-acetylneuraminic acid mutarotase